MPPESRVWIEEVDVATDEDRVHTAYELVRDAYAADPAPFPLDPEAEMTASLRSLDRSRTVVSMLLASLDGQPAGVAVVNYPQRDNRHSARVNLVVHPDHRRRGVGRSLLDAVGQRAREAGRSVLHGEYRQLDAAAASAGRAFAQATGTTPVGRSLEQVLTLALLTDHDLHTLREEVIAVAPAATVDYELLRWIDRVPDELVAGWASLRARMSTDMPVEDRPDEPESWDTARVRDSERRYGASGRRQLVSAARHRATGTLVGYTFLTVSSAAPATAYQEDTLVVAGHRGHRLGLLLKIDTLLVLRATSPSTQRILTWNASTNTPMLAVNAALGFTVTAEECEVRLALS